MHSLGVFVDPARIAEAAVADERFTEMHRRAMAGELSPPRPAGETPVED